MKTAIAFGMLASNIVCAGQIYLVMHRRDWDSATTHLQYITLLSCVVMGVVAARLGLEKSRGLIPPTIALLLTWISYVPAATISFRQFYSGYFANVAPFIMLLPTTVLVLLAWFLAAPGHAIPAKLIGP